MIEKITVRLDSGSDFKLEEGKGCDELSPKALLLYAGALCAGKTTLMIMEKERIRPKRFEISISGELTTERMEAGSEFRSLHVVYNVECDTDDDQVKVSRAVTLAHEKYCGTMRMLRRIAPVSHEIAVVSTEPEAV